MRRATIAAMAMLVVGAVGCGDTGSDEEEADLDPIDACDWAMFGFDLAASNTQPCDTAIDDDSVADLGVDWYLNTRDAVSAMPIVVDGAVYVGDWSGRFYAIDAESGEERWTFDADVHPVVYAGQIVASAAVTDVDDQRLVLFAGGKTMYALDAVDGDEVWRHEIGRPGDDTDPTEIESSPVVADGLVIFGYDVHNSREGEPAGVRALDVATGEERWTITTAPSEGSGATGAGCADVWGSVSVDLDRRLVFFGTGNCVTEEWGRFSEALVAVSLDDGEPVWTFQPHDANHDDLDFAGQPNLFQADGRDVVGLGNKDGSYYAVDRETGEEVWRAEATEPGLRTPGSNFSTGGFIGSSAVAEGMVVGATGVGPGPFLHAFDADTGEVAWQNQTPAASYAPTTTANGLAFVGGTDFTMRAYRLADGEILWEHPLGAAIAGGAVVVGDNLYAVAGLREPGLEPASEGVGITRFSLDADAEGTTSTAAPPGPPPDDVAEEGMQPCLGSPCDVPFSLTEPPPGTTPALELEIGLDPWTVSARATGLGDPSAWVRPGSPDAEEGATAYALMMSESDSNPIGGLLCVLEPTGAGSDELGCTTEEIPRAGATYNRITLLALADPSQFPDVASGVNRLMTTISFDPPLYPQP